MKLFTAGETYSVWDVADMLELPVTEVVLHLLTGQLEMTEDGLVSGEAADAFVAEYGFDSLVDPDDRVCCGPHDLVSVAQAATFLRATEEDVIRLLDMGVLQSRPSAEGPAIVGASIIEALSDYLESDDNDPARRGLTAEELAQREQEDVVIDPETGEAYVAEPWAE